ncbi:precorrin-6y C5,15-methyltransferase (decarboxylating) subunit CbiE [Mahella australiensis]|uniref:Precorrin-6y C5,15-methyltransferase (Decarboxylating), CbiE subunit n=1 Tax=Mahella australiensis (strain DSM 15567 / CIP 107919 / 50-1 BON) TaxID=697281 RepID=F3ZW45_MAHA5|nr:precorrin-6y C5,15-methyltransferase (decarboxylating) subunit CbiE [Mahella australiensis]AEE96425.1 precorrin-6y C5,15-methyltransferase (decarboxylating), CbiE subunit [Mahella australiensis 50-1 BON]
MYNVYVIGMGPGHEDYIVPAATKAIEQADVLVGAKRHLERFDNGRKRMIALTGDLSAVVNEIERCRQYWRVAVLVSGDPGFYSLLAFLRRYFDSEELSVIPGISSMQMLAAAVGDTWSDMAVFSAHGRSLEGLERLLSHSDKVLVLTDDVNCPAAIARFMIERGMDSFRIAVGENLSYDDQRIRVFAPYELAMCNDISPLNVMAVWR